MSSTTNPAPGWYPAPHANNEQRYWDGQTWLEATPEQAAAASQLANAPQATSGPGKPARRLKWWAWVLIGFGALVVISMLINAINGGGSDSDPVGAAAPITSQEDGTDDLEPVAEPEPEPEPEMVDVPDVSGATADEAAATLRELGLEPVVSTDGSAEVTDTDPAAGSSIEAGSEVTINAVEKPELTIGQENAIRAAENYLQVMPFSRSGLIKQLEFEKFDSADAKFAVDALDVDWNEQAAISAENYLELMSFSRSSLIDQLVFEGYTREQAEYGATAVGY